MKKNLHNIDKLFKAALDDHTEHPPESVWDAIDQHLDKNKVVDINRKYVKLKRIAVALLVLLLGFGAYTLNHWTKTNNQSAIDSTAINNKKNIRQNNSAASVQRLLNKENKTAIAETITTAKSINTDSAKTINISPAKNNNAPITAPGIIQRKNSSGFSITEKKGKIIEDTVANGQTVSINKSKQKTTSTNGSYEESGIENAAAAVAEKDKKNKNTATVFGEKQNKNVANLFAGKENNTKDQTLAPLSAIHPQLLHAAELNNTTGRKTITPENFPGDLTLSQNYHRKKVVKNAGSLAATVFFAPNISSNFLKDELHERSPGGAGQPPGGDHDDKERIRQGEQRQFSYSFGVLLDYNLNKHWSLQSGIAFISKTIHINPKTIYADTDDNGQVKYRFNCSSGYTYLSSKTVANPVVGDSMQAFESTNTLHYISVPLAVKYHYYLNKIDLFATAGTAINMLTKGKIETQIGNAANKEMSISNKINGLKSSYFSGNIGLGLSYTVTRSIAVSFMPSYNFALNSSTRDARVKTYPNTISLAAGIRYKL
jgi:hypothetical protein